MTLEPGSTEWLDRVSEVAQSTAVPPGTWWYLSFAKESEGFLGACYVLGLSLPDALIRSHILNINPGGEVLVLQVPDEIDAKIPERFKEKLMNKDDCAACDEEMGE